MYIRKQRIFVFEELIMLKSRKLIESFPDPVKAS